MDLIAFALIVTLEGEPEPWIASHWMRLQHCLADARLLSRREPNYLAVQALCKPVKVDPNKVRVNGFKGGAWKNKSNSGN